MNISENFDQTVVSLDTVSQNIIYSNLVKENFSQYLENIPEEKVEKLPDDSQNTKVLYDLLITMIGPNRPIDQLNLYGLSKGKFSVGLRNTTSLSSVKDTNFYEKTMKETGKKHIFLSQDKQLAPYFSYPEGNFFLSLAREYYTSRNTPLGIIEVKKSMSSLINTIRSNKYPYDEKIYVFDGYGSLLYPVTKINESNEYFHLIHSRKNNVNSLDANSYLSYKQQKLFYRTSSYSGLTTIVAVNEISLMKPILHYIITTLFIFILVCLSIVGLSYIISRRISIPLRQMFREVSLFKLDSKIQIEKKLPEINTPILELSALYQALIDMQHTARLSMAKELQLQRREMQSQMLALQAQMNPHFLYNSLATIQAMADEGLVDDIQIMCQNISDILRYISSDSQPLVPLKDEIYHTCAYLDTMKVRYNDQLFYTIDISKEMEEIKVPKLCIQLIVENSIKFSTKKSGPWIIQIIGINSETDWKVLIKDNGPGFTENDLHELEEKMREIDETGTLSKLEISGMGLMNIYIRFRLLYSQKHVFILENNVPTGAIVTIGGIYI